MSEAFLFINCVTPWLTKVCVVRHKFVLKVEALLLSFLYVTSRHRQQVCVCLSRLLRFQETVSRWTRLGIWTIHQLLSEVFRLIVFYLLILFFIVIFTRGNADVVLWLFYCQSFWKASYYREYNCTTSLSAAGMLELRQAADRARCSHRCRLSKFVSAKRTSRPITERFLRTCKYTSLLATKHTDSIVCSLLESLCLLRSRWAAHLCVTTFLCNIAHL